MNKYAYGALYWGGSLHEQTLVYPLSMTPGYRYDDGMPVPPYYSISNEESEYLQGLHKVNLNLKVYNKSNDIYAEIIMENNDQDNSVYVYKKNVLFEGNHMCENMFLITTKHIRLDYLGDICNFGNSIDINDWIEIKSNRSYKFKIKLNDLYKFPIGNNRYNIGSLEFSFANKNWFIESTIDEYLFKILNYLDLDHSSTPRFEHKQLLDFLYSLGFYNMTNNAYSIRTRQVVINIDGNIVRDNPCFYGRCQY